MAGTGQQEARYDFLDVIIVGCIFMFFLFPVSVYLIMSNWETIKAWSWLLVFGIIPIGLFVSNIRKDYRIFKNGDAAEHALNYTGKRKY